MAPPNWERYVRAATAGVAVVGAAYTLYNYVMAPTIALMCTRNLAIHFPLHIEASNAILFPEIKLEPCSAYVSRRCDNITM